MAAQPRKTTDKLPPISGKAVNGLQRVDVPLTDMQRRFVMYLVHDKMGQGIAAKAAGYRSPSVDACGLMKNPKIQAAIARERLEYAVASGVTKKKVIDGFMEAIDMARMKGDPLTMVSGWREVGKMCGFYEPTKTKVEISVNGQVMVQRMQAMSDEELLALANDIPVEGEFEVIEHEEAAGQP